MDIKSKSKIYIFIQVLVLLLLISYIVWLEYNKNILVRKTENLQTENQSYLKEFDKLKIIAASSTASFEDLRQVLSKVVEEEGFKNKTLEEKLLSLERLTKSDPYLLKKYSKVYFLDENYKPQETQVISSNYVLNKKTELKLHVDVMYFLVSMIEDAKKEGLNLLVLSSYRSFSDQASLKSQKKIIYGAGTANRFVAEQGYSEHQLGTTVDFTTPSIKVASIAFERTKEYEWLQNNAHKYGFVLSYPKGNAYYAYEPWHWRFVVPEQPSLPPAAQPQAG